MKLCISFCNVNFKYIFFTVKLVTYYKVLRYLIIRTRITSRIRLDYKNSELVGVMTVNLDKERSFLKRECCKNVDDQLTPHAPRHTSEKANQKRFNSNTCSCYEFIFNHLLCTMSLFLKCILSVAFTDLGF